MIKYPTYKLALVFAPYIGNKIAMDQSRFMEEQKDPAFTLGGVTDNSFYATEPEIWYDFEADNKGELIDKLILRPLSEIIDEDAIKVAYMFYPNQAESNIQGKELANHVREIINDPEANLSFEWPACAFQYLQSKGYDLPHYLLDGKTLHEAGLAIYESEIKK